MQKSSQERPRLAYGSTLIAKAPTAGRAIAQRFANADGRSSKVGSVNASARMLAAASAGRARELALLRDVRVSIRMNGQLN